MEERGVSLALEPEEEPTTDSEVFYNPDMTVNRDISSACLSVFQEDTGREIRVCDALAASGIRGIRYLKEVDGLEEVLINDIKPEAAESIRENLELNGIEDGRVSVTRKDANLLLTEEFRSLDYVDVDPFGSPAPYLDSTARALNHRGAVAFTATDLGPLYGTYPDVCRRRYGSRPLKSSFGHEVGLRILVKEVFRSFSRYDYLFRPLMCWHEQHYSRVFGTVEESKAGCNRALDNLGALSFCRGCRWRGYGREDACPECGGEVETAGELWTGGTADSGFTGKVVERLEESGFEEAEKLANLVGEESGLTTPFYDTHELASTAGVEAPGKGAVLRSLEEAGYQASSTHFSPQGFRTDAPMEAVMESLRPG